MQYLGPSFCGWQMQSSAIPFTLKGKNKKPSIDGVLNAALRSFAGDGNFMNLKISSRTDAGVHAFRNTLQVDIRPRNHEVMENYASGNVLKGLNYHLENYSSKKDLRIKEVSRCSFGAIVNDGGIPGTGEPYFFDVKSMASSRTYSYRIFYNSRPTTSVGREFPQPGSVHCHVDSFNRRHLSSGGDSACDDRNTGGDYSGAAPGRMFKPDAKEVSVAGRRPGDHSSAIFTRRSAWDVPAALDVSAMQEAAHLLVGVHDFTTFRSARCDSVTPFRDVMDIRVESVSPPFGDFSSEGKVISSREHLQLNHKELVVVTITASSFVRRMVRNIVSALVHVGRGKISPCRIEDLLNMRDREVLTREGCEPAPAHGLYLMRVNYDMSVEEMRHRKRRWESLCKK